MTDPDKQTDPTPESDSQVFSTYKTNLEVHLHPDEVAQAADRLAALENEYQAMLEERKAVLGSLNAKKTKIEAERAEVARTVRTKKKVREVGCTVTGYFSTNKVVTTRNDTGEAIDTRAMRTEERQSVLKVVEGKAIATSLLDEARKPEPEKETKQVVVDACTAAVLAGLCTVHGSECPNPDTLASREAQPKSPPEMEE
ncbi:MAG: hypothetical protein SFW67_28550 [Myxococcaceae bacterium]|nr:hypothetical protein [Myxococcaceae bacterium]